MQQLYTADFSAGIKYILGLEIVTKTLWMIPISMISAVLIKWVINYPCKRILKKLSEENRDKILKFVEIRYKQGFFKYSIGVGIFLVLVASISPDHPTWSEIYHRANLGWLLIMLGNISKIYYLLDCLTQNTVKLE